MTSKRFFALVRRGKDYLRYLLKRESLIRNLLDGQRGRYREYRKSGFARTAAYYAAINEICSHGYITEHFYYAIMEPKLNRRCYVDLFSEKNFFDMIFPDTTPRTLARVINSRIVDRDFRPVKPGHFAAIRSPEVIVKPSLDSGGGQGIHFLDRGDTEKFLDRHIERFPNVDLIVQEPIRQNARYGKFNPSSVNTLRILTLRVRGEIRVLSTVFRIGRSGARIDNQSTGGVACGVEHGILRRTALDVLGNVYEEHPDSGIRFGGYELPRARDGETLCSKLHDRIPSLDIISWDVALSEDDKLIVIEMNADYQGINIHQTLNGPVFADVRGDLG